MVLEQVPCLYRPGRYGPEAQPGPKLRQGPGAQRGEGRERLVAGRDERVDVHKAPPLPPGKVDVPVGQGEQGIVPPPPHTGTGVETGAPLAHDDRPGADTPPSNTFTPRRCPALSRPLRVLPPPLVFDTCSSLPGDRRHFDRRIPLPVPPGTSLAGL